MNREFLDPAIENLAQTLVDQGLGAYVEQIMATSQPALTRPIRLGGVPHLDKEQPWPAARISGQVHPEHRSLPFLAQLDFSLVAPIVGGDLFPDTGLVSFFYDFETTVSPERLHESYSPPDSGWCVVLSSEFAEARAFPDDIPPEKRFGGHEYDPTPEWILTLPSQDSGGFGDVKAAWADDIAPEDDDDYGVDPDDLFDNYSSVLGEQETLVQVLGHPQFIQGDARQPGEVLLLQVSELLSDEDYAWAGMKLYFFIDENDLRAGRLDKIRFDQQR